jgi:hypothetical protein
MASRLRRNLMLDGLMLTLVMIEFAYGLTGSTLHELLGLLLLGLFFLHGSWNRAWFGSLLKGRYRGVRIVMLAINGLLLVAAVLMMVSGLVNSDLQFRATGVEPGWLPRELHTASANCFLVLMAIHLGLHWKPVMAEAGRLVGFCLPPPLRARVLPILAVLISGFGVYASLERSLYARMVAYYSFGDWNFDESVAGFFVQYLAIVGLYASVAHYALRFGKSTPLRFTRCCAAVEGE